MLAHAAGRSVTGVRLGDWCVDATLGGASRFVEDVHHAVARGDLAPRFRPADARRGASWDCPAGHYPLHRLAGHTRDQIEVAVVVEHGHAFPLSHGGGQ